MKLTKDALKQIIKEELENMDSKASLYQEEQMEEGKLANIALGAAAAIGALGGQAKAETSIDTTKLADNIAQLIQKINTDYANATPQSQQQILMKVLQAGIEKAAKTTPTAQQIRSL